MSKTIENLTLRILVREIENILDGSHYHAYRHIFVVPEVRQQLMTNVLNRVPACYALVENNDSFYPSSAIIPNSIQIQLHYVVAEEIERLVDNQNQSDWVAHHVPQENNPAFAPSNWFG